MHKYKEEKHQNLNSASAVVVRYLMKCLNESNSQRASCGLTHGKKRQYCSCSNGYSKRHIKQYFQFTLEQK